MQHKVKDIMTSVVHLAVVEEGATLFEAILAIGEIRKLNPAYAMRCPAALVTNGDRQIIGFLDFRSMIKGLEPRYGEIAETAREIGPSAEWIESELKKHGLWANALDDICKTAGEILVKNLMAIPGENQMIDVNTSLNEALFRMVVAGKDYMLVREGEMLAGVISFSDILAHVCDAVKECRI